MSNHPMKPPRISKHPHQYSEQERYDAYNKTNKNNNNRNNNNKNQNTIALMTGCNFSLVTLVLLLMIVSILHNTEMIYDAVYDLKPGENAPGFWSSGGNNGNNKEGRREGPRIVLMAGPHKTASSSLQQFFAEFAGSSVLLEHKLPEAAGFAHRELRYPHPANTEWVVPILPRKAGGVIKSHHALAQFVAEKSSAEFPNWEEEIGPDPSKRGAIANWFRRHVRARWDDGKKLILAAEALDYVTVGLRDHRCGGNGGGNGERTHLAPGADEKIDTLLELLPWEHHLDDENENDDDDENNDNQSDNRKQPPLRLDDIEVQINYRTPRFDHLVSLWHQMGNTQTLRDWLVKPKTMSELLLYENLTTINALGEALQFVRRGIRVTLIDMAGVAEREKRSGNAAGRVPPPPGITVVGGIQGVVACEILRMDRQGLCDADGRLRIPGFPSNPELRVNVRGDKEDQALTSPQIDAITGVLDRYDCGVRRHLRKYESRGLLRILHPSPGLFASCDDKTDKTDDIPDLSFCQMVRKIVAIASEDNGIPTKNKKASKGGAKPKPKQ